MALLQFGKWSFAAFAVTAVLSFGQGRAAEPPKVGEQATDFTLPAVAGQIQGEVKLSEMTERGPVALIVLRGFPGYQCGICSRQVSGLVSSAEKLAAAGVQVLMVYPGPAEGLDRRAEEFLKGATLPAGFTMVIDPDYQFVNQYGLRWDAPRETAYPSTFVINKDRRVVYAQVSKTHGGRAEPKEILGAVASSR
jgi:peroxiredoxin